MSRVEPEGESLSINNKRTHTHNEIPTGAVIRRPLFFTSCFAAGVSQLPHPLHVSSAPDCAAEHTGHVQAVFPSAATAAALTGDAGSARAEAGLRRE